MGTSSRWSLRYTWRSRVRPSEGVAPEAVCHKVSANADRRHGQAEEYHLASGENPFDSFECETVIPLGPAGERPTTVIVDMSAAAGRYPVIVSLLAMAGLTAQQCDAYRLAPAELQQQMLLPKSTARRSGAAAPLTRHRSLTRCSHAGRSPDQSMLPRAAVAAQEE